MVTEYHSTSVEASSDGNKANSSTLCFHNVKVNLTRQTVTHVLHTNDRCMRTSASRTRHQRQLEQLPDPPDFPLPPTSFVP